MLSRAALSSKCERKQSCAATDGTVDVGGLVGQCQPEYFPERFGGGGLILYTYK